MDECKSERYMKQCESRDAFACFDRLLRTTGKSIELCSQSYGECVERKKGFTDDPETASTTDCVIYRYSPP